MILRDGAVELLNVLFPHLAGVRVERVMASGRSVQLEAATCTAEAECSICGQPSKRVHSRYRRWLDDREVGGRAVAIRLQVRRFFCGNAECVRRIFAEQVPGLTAPHRRCTPALRAMLVAVVLALGGRAGARMTSQLGAPRSRATLLRLLRALPEPEPGALRAVGVDEFALRRGQVYGTVLIDMDTRRPVDLLADRTADTLAAWLKEHPGVRVVCRDRAGPYADGAGRGAPDALQVADRWHLLHNLADAVERIVKRHRSALIEPGRDQPEGADAPACAGSAEPPGGCVAEGRLVVRTRQRHADVHALVARGMNIATICRTLQLDPKTVRRFIGAASPEELLGARGPRATSVDRYKAYLAGRVAEGCTNGAKLWNEIRAQGFRGSSRTVRRFLNTLGVTSAKVDLPEEFSAREVRAWILRRPDDLDPKDRDRLQGVCDRCAALATTTEIAREFAHMLRERRGRYLATWIQQVEASDIPELRSFAAGLCKDWDAVKAGLTLAWSSGVVEGHVNRIKMFKRQMYGRANLELLRRRVLLAP